MDVKLLLKKVTETLHKYRHAALIVVIGLILMAIPGFGSTKTKPEETTKTVAELTTEEKLSQILSKIRGAGEVYVMLTVGKGAETLYQTNEAITTGADSGSTRIDTVTVTDSQRDQTGLVRQTNPPEYLGAIIVCDGADNPTVRLAVVDAVSKATGLGADHISVLKTK